VGFAVESRRVIDAPWFECDCASCDLWAGAGIERECRFETGGRCPISGLCAYLPLRRILPAQEILDLPNLAFEFPQRSLLLASRSGNQRRGVPVLHGASQLGNV